MSAGWKGAIAGVCVAAFGMVTPVPVAAGAPSVQMSVDSEQILRSMVDTDNSASRATPGARSDMISAQFLGTRYGADTLVGSATEAEQLVVDLQDVDCFTYADYVEALKRAHTPDEFLTNLVSVRYKNGAVSFSNRKHFFTDWAAASPALATDVTAGVSDQAIRTQKTLNAKDSGGVYLPGIPVVPREVSYIPSAQVTPGVVDRLRTGDYLGAYASDSGLDVTHVGIFIDAPGGPVFRNASSLQVNEKVVDTPLSDYLHTVPGVVVLRPVM